MLQEFLHKEDLLRQLQLQQRLLLSNNLPQLSNNLPQLNIKSSKIAFYLKKYLVSVEWGLFIKPRIVLKLKRKIEIPMLLLKY